MNHQPFESWILDHKSLTAEQKKQLVTHLSTCKRCQQLDSAWHLAESQLKKALPVSPEPGFAARWRESLPARQAAHQKEDGRRWLIGLSSAAGLTLLILIVLNSNPESVSSVFTSVANFYTRISGLFNQARNFMFILANTIPTYVWVAIIAALVIGLLVTGLVGSYALTRLKKGTVTNENETSG